jgi:DNA-binding CsgD family transcriptional regulator
MVRERRAALTERQRQILRLVKSGLTNKEIAEDLGITDDGVKAHLSRLFLRYGVTNRVGLLAAADGDLRGDRALASTGSLANLRALAGRANAAGAALSTSADSGISAKLAAVRDALAAVDGALAIVGDLPPETTGSVLAAVRKRLASAFDAIDNAQAEAGTLHTA